MPTLTRLGHVPEIMNPDPPYKQLAEFIRADIRSGKLKPGEAVPTTKQLTEEYGVAMSTAARALALLRDEAWTVSRPSKSAVVAPSQPKDPE
jgi:DNA-binding GntR family transcriptional regulator